MRKKKSGQVYTPDYLVCDILDTAGYYGKTILGKHVIDNSAGDGAFLQEIVKRYCKAFLSANNDRNLLKDNLQSYIHGIEIEPSEYLKCLENLNGVAKQFDISGVCWDVLCGDALKEKSFNGKMDYVVGNPPYVRVHNLQENYCQTKQFRFAQSGMTDLYLVFFEVGFNMLATGGKLCYITPSSWLNSLAGKTLREYILQNGNLLELIDLEHFQAFDATTYTLISLFEKGCRHESFLYSVYDGPTRCKKHIEQLKLRQVFINGEFYLAKSPALLLLQEIRTGIFPRRAVVKNGFATLADSVFINTKFAFVNHTIPVVKASTGKWYSAFYPYDNDGRPLKFNELCREKHVGEYLENNKHILLKGKPEQDTTTWFLYGRTQAIKDVWHDKIAVNTCIKDVASIKINFAPKGNGVYSGLYIMSETSCDVIKKMLQSEDFLNYVKLLKKYKSGGYYTFSSKDLEVYLNYRLNQLYK